MVHDSKKIPEKGREVSKASSDKEAAPEEPSPEQIHARYVRTVIEEYGGDNTGEAVLGYD